MSARYISASCTMEKHNKLDRSPLPKNRLREERERRGWSQKDLADYMDLPDTRTVGRWENGKTFPHPHYVRELCRVFERSAEELGLLKQPSRSDGLGDISQTDQREAAAFWQVPALFSSCIGRTQEIETICALLKQSDVRWLTILGPGGMGKTRLVIETANQIREYFADGVCYVSCTALTDPSLVFYTIAGGLGVQENGDKVLIDHVKDILQAKNFLLIMDGFERVADAAPLVEKLLASCTHLKVLVTSRVALHLQAERELPLGPLSLPPVSVSAEPEAPLSYPSVALFVQRAQALFPVFQLTQSNASAIAEICRHLDGLPLAIELAASLIKIFPPRVLLTQILQQRFEILKREQRSLEARRQTLYETIKWSYDLLGVEEQWLFRQIAIFAGGCSLEAIEMLCRRHEQRPLAALDILKSFIDKSLMQRQSQEEMFPYFTLLESVREFGIDCLRRGGEWEASQQAHSAYYLALMEQAEPHLKGTAQEEWLARLECERENLRRALTWMINQKQVDQALRFCEVFGKFCGLRGYWSEERQWLEMVLEQAEAEPPTWILGRVLRRAGHLAYRFRDLRKAHLLLEKSVALSRKLGDQSNLTGSLSGLGWVLYRQKHVAAAEPLLQESVEVARRSGDGWALSNALESSGRFLHLQGSLDQASRFLEESVLLARTIGDKENLARILCTLVTIQISQGEVEQAEVLAWESYALAQECANKPLIALALDGLADVAFFQEEYEKAAELYERRLLFAQELDDWSTIARKKLRLGDIAFKQGEFDLSSALVQESLEVLRLQADNPSIALALCIEGDIKRVQHASDLALRLYQEALLLEQDIWEKQNIGRCVIGLACVFLDQGHLERTVQLLGFAHTCLGSPGKMTYLTLATNYRLAIDRTRALVDRETFDALWAAGRELSYEGVLRLCEG